MPPPRPGSAEQVFVCDLTTNEAGDTRVLVSGLTDEEAVSLQFNKRTLPCFSVWRNTPAEADGYVLGIEPGTNFPNPHSFEQGHNRVVNLKPGETWHAAVEATWHVDSQSITEAERATRAIQGDSSPDLFAAPRAEWSK